MSEHEGIAEGWYQDPRDALRERYWDGSDWTEGVRVKAPTRAESAQPTQSGSAAVAPAITLPAAWTGRGAFAIGTLFVLVSLLTGVVTSSLVFLDALATIGLPSETVASSVIELLRALGLACAAGLLVGAYVTPSQSQKWFAGRSFDRRRLMVIALGLAAVSFGGLGVIATILDALAARNGEDVGNGFNLAGRFLALIGIGVAFVRTRELLPFGGSKIGSGFVISSALLALAYLLFTIAPIQKLIWFGNNYAVVPSGKAPELVFISATYFVLAISLLVAAGAFRENRLGRRDSQLAVAAGVAALAFVFSVISGLFLVSSDLPASSGFITAGVWTSLFSDIWLPVAFGVFAVSFFLNNRQRRSEGLDDAPVVPRFVTRPASAISRDEEPDINHGSAEPVKKSNWTRFWNGEMFSDDSSPPQEPQERDPENPPGTS